MENLDDVKSLWLKKSGEPVNDPLDQQSFEHLIRRRAKKENGKTMHYFWAAFVYHNLIYGFTAYLTLTKFDHNLLWIFCAVLALAYIPYTIVMMTKFKKINGPASRPTLAENLEFRYDQLNAFLKFKRLYEWFAVPVSCTMITFIIFQLWVPGSWTAQVPSMSAVWMLCTSAFAWSIQRENRRNFQEPLHSLGNIIKDLKEQQSPR